ncbi:NADH-quinone oxidoreductase subunit NuoN [Candidatus Nitrosacidococcus sp. I8]|uniref:NADH-quinone oxidoreductase subunit NuoN n=1 Tax=Candidatus Nitrosacidococcus sp. I8 TaxID=2942908 RepID=UPI002225C7BA|nr:NADH-quinone oxidoreductase subunit NuoN [Candidatus Nitrosacidococcus sp. I8]CAH9016626.1 NADH-quinone oxidoreductase subunit N [Candidatus Nitrosacidococcus sp. I8]
MSFDTPNFLPALPEILTLGMGCVLLLAVAYSGAQSGKIAYKITQATLIILALVTLYYFDSSSHSITFNNSYIKDPLSDSLKIFIYLTVFLVFLYSRDYLQARNLEKGEFYILGLFGMLGIMVITSAHHFLLLYLGLELLSLSQYAMVALNRNNNLAAEAAMKYFVLGSLASGMLLYGMSMIYGVTGSLEIDAIANTIAKNTDGNSSIVLAFGLVFIMAALAFKFGAVPFHMWLPDVYHGAPTAVTLYIGTAPKVAAFAMLMRLLVDSLEGIQPQWEGMMIILASLSMVLGNIVAIAQSNIKRMLAYSAISHMGFLFLGTLTGTHTGYAASMFYIIIYTLMSLGSFGMIALLSRSGFESDQIENFKGLNERSPWFAFMMLILMFAMMGFPPTAGFYAKWAVIMAIIDKGLIWLAIVAVVSSVIGAFYYLRVVKYMYFDKSSETTPLSVKADFQWCMSGNSLALLGLGLFPSSLMNLCLSALS